MEKRKVFATTLLFSLSLQCCAILPACAEDTGLQVSGTFSGFNAKEGDYTITEDAHIKNVENSGTGTLTNKGTIDGTVKNSNQSGTFTNEGTITTSEKGSENKGTFKNSGNLTNGAKGEITNSGDFTNNSAIQNNGKIENKDNGKFSNKAMLNNGKSGEEKSSAEITGNLLNDGGVINNFGKITNSGIEPEGDKGLQNQNGGIIYNQAKGLIEGTVVNGEGSTLYNEADAIIQGKKGMGSLFNEDGNVINSGTIQSEINSTGGVITNNQSGTIGVNEEPDLSIEGSNTTVNNFGNITGGIDLDNSTINNNGTIDLKNQELANTGNEEGKSAGDLIVNSSGTIKGGTIGSDDENAGNVVVNSTGTLGSSGEEIKITGKKTTVNNEGKIDGTVKVEKDGTLRLGAGTTFSNGANIATEGFLDARNGKFEDLSNNTTLLSGAKLASDISSATGQTDIFKNGSSAIFGPNGVDVTLEDFNFIPDTLLSNGFISKEELKRNMGFSGNDGVNFNFNIKDGVQHKALSPLRWLEATSTSEGIGFSPTGSGYKDFNPAIMAGAIAAQFGGYLNELNSFDEAFRNMDMYMLVTKKQRTAMKLRNKYASASGNYVFDPTGTPYDDYAAWIRPYATFESVKLRGGAKVSNVAYGSYFGTESEMYELKNGWDAMWGAYIGYNGSHQAYDGVGIYQNGGTLGLVGMLYKGDFFTGLTINAGANSAIADTMYGTDDFTLLMGGIASKTGYNWELAEGKFIIQPSFMLSYAFVNTFDYTSSSGSKVDPSLLNAITFEPRIKLIGNLKNGWQPYLGVSVVWNVMDKTKFQASDTTLPELSVKPFAKYGLGVRKTWGERLTGFIQAYVTSGGRNGVGLQAGVSYTFGKSGKPIAQKNNLKPALAKTEIKMNNVKYDEDLAKQTEKITKK